MLLSDCILKHVLNQSNGMAGHHHVVCDIQTRNLYSITGLSFCAFSKHSCVKRLFLLCVVCLVAVWQNH